MHKVMFGNYISIHVLQVLLEAYPILRATGQVMDVFYPVLFVKLRVVV